MRSKPVEALEVVATDLLSAAAHYLTWRCDGAEHILARYDETVRWIEWNPELFPVVYGSIQRAIIKNTYFVVYFLQEDARTLVVAVLDGRRNPAKIRSIVSGRRKRSG